MYRKRVGENCHTNLFFLFNHLLYSSLIEKKVIWWPHHTSFFNLELQHKPTIKKNLSIWKGKIMQNYIKLKNIYKLVMLLKMSKEIKCRILFLCCQWWKAFLGKLVIFGLIFFFLIKMNYYENYHFTNNVYMYLFFLHFRVWMFEFAL